MHETIDPREPYRLFFPLGILMALAGVTPWIFHAAGLLETYPIVFHGRVMFHGFLMAFISGFLMTAIPRMSGSPPCEPFEASAVLALLIGQLSFGGSPKISAAIFSAHAAVLLFFFGRRFIKRRRNPPSMFLFVPVGLMTAFGGGFLLLFSDELSPAWNQLGRLWAFQAFVLNLIVGLGSRLIPVLSRAPHSLSPLQSGKDGSHRFLPLLILFNASFPLEAFLDSRIGIALRALTLTWAAVDGLRLLAPMRPITGLGVALRTSTFFLFAPYYLLWFFPAGGLHWFHLIYIGGIGLMTMMVAVRVVLAHGGAGLDLEVRSPGLITAAGLILLATLTRAFVPTWSPQESLPAFTVAAVFWVTALILWSLTLGRHLKRPWAVLQRTPS